MADECPRPSAPLAQVAEIQGVVRCIMEEKDRLQVAHQHQLVEAEEAMEARVQQVRPGGSRVGFPDVPA